MFFNIVGNDEISLLLCKFIDESTDVGIAKCFKELYGKNHICCSIKEKIWYYFDDNNKIWENDERLMVRYKLSESFLHQCRCRWC